VTASMPADRSSANTRARNQVSPSALTSSSSEPVQDQRLGRRLEVGEERAEGVRHAESQHGDADQVGAAEQAESKPVGWQFVEVVVVPEEVGGLGSANRSDFITAGYECLASGVPMPPHDALLMPALAEVGGG